MPNSPVVLHPAALAEQTVESLYAMHGRQHPWIYWLCLLGVGAALGTLPLLQVEVTVQAAGRVRPATERTELKSAIGGRIARVLAADNERVTAGQPLLELTAGDAEERLARNRQLQREKRGLVSDLAILTAKYGELEQGFDPAKPITVATLTLKTPVLTGSQAQFLTQWGSGNLALAKSLAALERAVALEAKGIVTQQERLDARYAHARARSDLQLLAQQTLSAWQVQLHDEQTALDQLASEEKRLQDELILAIVRAPVAGTVQGLIGLNPGAFVLAGQSFGFISPDDRLLVETYVAPKDIGLLRTGQPARLQVEAYPYTQWGMLDARVESIAADATPSGQQAAFKVIVRPAALSLRLRNGVNGTLRKGMTVTARYVVARRSLLQVMFEDASRWLDPRSVPDPARNSFAAIPPR